MSAPAKWILVACANAISGIILASEARSPADDDLNRHAIAIDSEGRAIDPTIALKRHRDVLLTRRGYEMQIELIFAGIEEQAREGKLSKKAVLLWVHGGNNFITGSIRRAGELAKPINDDGYYPVSICWSSNIPSAWWEQMRYVRNGVYFKGQNDAWAIATAPVYVVTDFATAIVRFPRTALDKLYSTLKSVAPNAYDKIRAGQFRYQVLQARERQFGYRPPTRTHAFITTTRGASSFSRNLIPRVAR